MDTLFVAHACADTLPLQRLLAQPLPGGARARIFPPITVGAHQRVSDDLIAAIRASDGLIYLRTEASLASLWVVFERNFALRIGKPVYAFAPEDATFTIDEGPAIDPTVAVTWNMAVESDSFAVRNIALDLLDRHRFNILGDKWARLDNDFRQMMDSPEGLAAKLDGGGVVLLQRPLHVPTREEGLRHAAWRYRQEVRTAPERPHGEHLAGPARPRSN